MGRFSSRFGWAKSRQFPIALALALAAVALNATPGKTHPASAFGPDNNTQLSQRPSQIPETESGQTDLRKWERRQKKELLKSNFEKMQQDARELADLSKALEDDLNKSNENVLSLKIVERADKIEKLAKKIKNSAKGL